MSLSCSIATPSTPAQYVEAGLKSGGLPIRVVFAKESFGSGFELAGERNVPAVPQL
jgi:hypothetical protein